MGPSLRWGDGKGSRRGAKVAEAHSPQRHAELGSASIVPNRPKGRDEKWLQGDSFGGGDGVIKMCVKIGCAGARSDHF